MTTRISQPLIGGALALMILASASPVYAEEEPLYERLGGLPAIALAVSEFVDDFIEDPVIMANPAVEEQKTPQAAPYIKFQVTALVCELTGGPCQYTGVSMEEAHDGLNVTAEEWDRMVEIFVATLDSLEVPEREQGELLELLGETRDDIVVAGG
jgi:hemoglobin